MCACVRVHTRACTHTHTLLSFHPFFLSSLVPNLPGQKQHRTKTWMPFGGEGQWSSESSTDCNWDSGTVGQVSLTLRWAGGVCFSLGEGGAGDPEADTNPESRASETWTHLSAGRGHLFSMDLQSPEEWITNNPPCINSVCVCVFSTHKSVWTKNICAVHGAGDHWLKNLYLQSEMTLGLLLKEPALHFIYLFFSSLHFKQVGGFII